MYVIDAEGIVMYISYLYKDSTPFPVSSTIINFRFTFRYVDFHFRRHQQTSVRSTPVIQ